MYALIENGEITRINIALPVNIGNTSIPDGATGLEAFGLHPIVGNEPSFNPATERMTGPIYEFDGDKVNRVYTIEAIPIAELVAVVQAEIVQAAQRRLDDFAQSRNYDDILSACTYAASEIPKFKAEGQCCVNARDETWAKLYEMLGEVQAGSRPMPTSYADIEPELPALVWPKK